MTAAEIVYEPQPVLAAGALTAQHLSAVVTIEVDNRPVTAVLQGIEHGYRILGDIPITKLSLITLPSRSRFYAEVEPGASVEVVEPSDGRRRRG